MTTLMTAPRSRSLPLFFAILFLLGAFPFSTDPSAFMEARHLVADRPDRSSPLDALYLPFDSLRTDPHDYAWPTDASVLLTSGFAEFRSTHFHAGIDISTNNRTGHRVFSTRDGYISRIFISPYGYGKMLYVRHPDGYHSTYAHLQRFNDEIEAYARTRQLKNEQYALDVEVEPHRLPVGKGEVIAYSGDTGIGSPHLHFEIRDERLNPVNPFLLPAFTERVTDNSAPVFEGIAFTPLGHTSIAESRHHTFFGTVRRASPTEYRLTAPVRLTGEIGVAVKAYDRANHAYYRNSIRSYTLSVDSLPLFTARLDRFPKDEAKQVAVFYDWTLLQERHGRFQKLYIEPGNRLPLYDRLPAGSGVLRTSEFHEGIYSLLIEATDDQGNTSRLRGEVILNHPPEIDVVRADTSLLVRSTGSSSIVALHVARRKPDGTWTSQRFASSSVAMNEHGFILPVAVRRNDILRVVAENAFGTRSAPEFILPKGHASKAVNLRVHHEIVRDYVLVTVTAPAPFTRKPALRAYSTPKPFATTMRATDLKTYTATVPLSIVEDRNILLDIDAEVGGSPLSQQELVHVTAITPERGGQIVSDDGLFSATFLPDAVYGPLYTRLEATKQGYALYPQDVVLNRGATIELRSAHASSDRSLGLYVTEGGGLRFAARAADHEGGVYRTRVSRFLGEYAILPDAQPPSVANVRSQATRTKLTLSFALMDNRSGIDVDRLVVRLNGEFLLAEYDPYRHRVHYEGNHSLSPGMHTLTIEAADRMGNVSNHSYTLRVAAR